MEPRTNLEDVEQNCCPIIWVRFRMLEVFSGLRRIPIGGRGGQNIPSLLVAGFEVLTDPVEKLWNDRATCGQNGDSP